MSRLTFYHAIPSRSSIVHWMLEEVGEPYETQLVDLKREENRTPGFLAINPLGKVPALRQGDVVMTEAAAICAYLADAFPRANLALPVNDPRRGLYFKWLFFGPSCIEPAIIDHAFPRKEMPPRTALSYGSYEDVLNVLSDATAKAGPYLLGQQFTAADVVVGSGLRWGMSFKLIPERPEFRAYVSRLEERPALKRTAERDARLLAERGSG